MVIAARRGAGGRATARAVATLAASCAAAALVAIWAAYGFRFSAVRGDQATTATMHVLSDAGRPRPTTPAGAWEAVLHDPATGADRRGPLPPLLRFARDHRLLPEAYLYGIAYVAKKGLNRAGYLRGQYTRSGFASYFAWAFAIKTPLPSLLLAAFGLVALVGRWRKQPQLPPFAWGSLVFALGYLAALHASALNLGLRHLLPIAPLWALAAAAAWPQGPPTPAARRWALLISALIGWLAFSTLMAAPHFLGYFNESVGGWRRGHLYLVDSNLDWGQDLLRLEKRLRGEQGPIYLAQADNPPFPPGLSALNPRRLFGSTNRAPFPERIAGGLYVISATELLGVYRPLARAETWRDPRWLDRFEQLTSAAALAARPTTDPPEGPDELEALRRMRLLARLSSREPDERLGTSLFLFRLTDQQVREATDP